MLRWLVLALASSNVLGRGLHKSRDQNDIFELEPFKVILPWSSGELESMRRETGFHNDHSAHEPFQLDYHDRVSLMQEAGHLQDDVPGDYDQWDDDDEHWGMDCEFMKKMGLTCIDERNDDELEWKNPFYDDETTEDLPWYKKIHLLPSEIGMSHHGSDWMSGPSEESGIGNRETNRKSGYDLAPAIEQDFHRSGILKMENLMNLVESSETGPDPQRPRFLRLADSLKPKDEETGLPLSQYSLNLIKHIPAYVSDPPPHEEAARMARYIAHRSDWAAMATISARSPIKGFPFANVFSVSDGTTAMSSGVPYLYLTPMEMSVHDLRKDSRASLTMSLAQGHYCMIHKYDPEDPRCAHIILTGSIQRVPANSTEEEFAKKALFSRHPEMPGWPEDHGWFVGKLDIQNVLVLDYFGGAKSVDVKEYFQATPY